MDEHLAQEPARRAARPIRTLADLREAEEYAESRVREFVVMGRVLSDEMRESGYEDICRERQRIYRTLAWAARMARRHQAAGERK